MKKTKNLKMIGIFLTIIMLFSMATPALAGLAAEPEKETYQTVTSVVHAAYNGDEQWTTFDIEANPAPEDLGTVKDGVADSVQGLDGPSTESDMEILNVLGGEEAATINLSEADGNVTISNGGNYILTGSTTRYAVTIDTAETVNLTLDNAGIRFPDDLGTGNAAALRIAGGAAVNMTVKEGTASVISNVYTGGNGIRIENGSLNIGGTGELSLTGQSYPLYSNGGSITIADAEITVSNTPSGTQPNGIQLAGSATLTVNSGSLTVALEEKPSSGTSGAISIAASGGSFVQNGGTVTIVNGTTGSSCYGIRSSGAVDINDGSLFAFGKTNGVLLAAGSTMKIADTAFFVAASGNLASFDSFKGAARCNSTGKFIEGKSVVSLNLNGFVTGGTELILKRNAGAGYTEESKVTLPLDTYYIAFAGKEGDTYCVLLGDDYVVSESNGLYSAVFPIGSFVSQPAVAPASVSSLPETFTVSPPEGVQRLKVGGAMPLRVSPNYVVNWSSSEPGVASVDSWGVVTAKSAGTATITAECLGITGTYNLTTVVMTDPRSFTLTVDNPDVTVEISDGVFLYVPVSVAGGIFTYLLEDGDYTYSVAREGFPTRTGEFTVSQEGENSVSVSMYYNVDFELIAGEGVSSTDGAEIKVCDSENSQVPGTGGSFDGLNGDYTYTVTLEGCYPASGSFSGVGVIKVVMNRDRSASPTADWSGAYNHNYGNAAMSAALPKSADEAYEKWAVMVGTLDNFGAGYAGATVIVDGYLYITGNGYLNKINTATGVIEEQVAAGTTGYMYDYLAYGDGTVFLAGSSYITAFEADTLTKLWRTSVGGQHSTQVNGSLNSKGTVGSFRPVIYRDGYIFCGKNAFKTTSFEVDENGYNMPVWGIGDDFNWNTGVVVGDYYYVAAVQTLYAVNYKTGEIVSTWKFSSDSNVYTWSGVAYSEETGRLYFASYSGAKLYSAKLDAEGKLITNNYAYPVTDRPMTAVVSQESVCTPVIYNGRVYLTGQKGNVDVLKAAPGQTGSTAAMETIYTVDTGERVKIQSTPILSTAYATEDNNDTVYLYFQGYSSPAPVYVLEDSAAVTSAGEATVSIVATPTKAQFAFEQIAVDHEGGIYFFNESGYLFGFDKLTSVTVDRVKAFINNLPHAQWITSDDKTQIENARKAYNALTDDEKTNISSTIYEKLTNAEEALAAIDSPPSPGDGDMIEVYFTLLGDDKHDSEEDGHVHTLKGGNLTTWIARTPVTVESGSTVGDIFSKVLDENGYTYTGLNRNYISYITTPGGLALGEFDNGPLSGWMYTVNGVHPNTGLNNYVLKDGDEIIWHYTDDYTQETDDEAGDTTPPVITTSAESKTVTTSSYTFTARAEDEVDGAVSVKVKVNGAKISGDAGDYSVTLKAGENTIEISAVDKAGNQAVRTCTVTYTSGSSGGGGGGGSSSTTITAGKGGTVKGSGATIQVPADALDQNIKIAIVKVTDTGNYHLRERELLASDIVEITKDQSGDFKKTVTVTLTFDKTKIDPEKHDLILCWYNRDTNRWVPLDNLQVDLTQGKITGEIDHLTPFAVIAREKEEAENPEPQAPSFELKDIKGHWAEENIKELVAAGAIQGYEDSTFKPNQPITRGEFAAILGKAYHLDSQGGKSFEDTAGHWAEKAVGAAAAQGILAGYSEKRFGPDDPITREQMAVMMVKAAQLSPAQGKAFADREAISAWAEEAVGSATAQGIMTGYEDNTFRPRAHATRAEAATVIVKAMKQGK